MLAVSARCASRMIGTMAKHDDVSYKFLYTCPEFVRDLLKSFVPRQWWRKVDFSTLERMPCSYVTDDFRQRADDVVWRVRTGQQWMYLYILIEFQSTVDTFMAVRVLSYLMLLYQDLIRRNESLPGRLLPPVLPIVLYNGETKWKAPVDVESLIAHDADFPVPRFCYHLIDESRYSEAQLARRRNLVAAVMRFNRLKNERSLVRVIREVRCWIDGRKELKRTLAMWMRGVLLRQRKGKLALPRVRDLEELEMSLAQRMDEWAARHEEKGEKRGEKRGEKKGITKGRREGAARVLQQLLARRFGPLPPDIVARLNAAQAADIRRWSGRLLAAESLDAVFKTR